MKSIGSIAFVACMVVLFGCQTETNIGESDSTSASMAELSKVVDQVVEASCGECQFGMDGNGCDLAIRIDGKSYYVDGAAMDDHGDAHGDDGMCNCVRQAKVSGNVKDGRFVSTSFELLPIDKEQQRAAKEDRLKKSRLGVAFAMSGQGLVIQDIFVDGAGGRAGLKKDDKIVKLNDKPVAEMDPDAIRAIFADAHSINFLILRDSESIEISVDLVGE